VKTYIIAMGLGLRIFFAMLRVLVADEHGSGFSLQVSTVIGLYQICFD